MLSRFLLSISSFSTVLYCYLIAKQFVWFYNSMLITNMVLFISILAIALVSIVVVYKSKSSETLICSSTKPMNGAIIPVYIGLFVIALELPQISNGQSSVEVIVLVTLFCLWLFMEKTSYFNPLWMAFGYRFYSAETNSGNEFVLITKRHEIKSTRGGQKFSNLIKVNNYTYIERKR